MKRTVILVIVGLVISLAPAIASEKGNPDRVTVTLPPEQRGEELRMLQLGPEVPVEEALAYLGPEVGGVRFDLPASVDPCNNGMQCAARVQQLCKELWSTADRVNFGNLCTGSCSSGHGITAASCSFQRGIRDRFIDGSIEKSIETARHGEAQAPSFPVGAESSGVACANWADKSCESYGGLEWFSFRQDACVYNCIEGATTVALQGK
jgi:hypothetical protein